MSSTIIPPAGDGSPWNYFFRRLQALPLRISAIEEDLDGLVSELEELITLRGLPAGALPARVGQLRADAARAERRRIDKERARHGAISVKLASQADGHALAEIDGRPGVLLPPFVAALLAVLIHDSGQKADQFVGWKSYEMIRLALKECTPKPLSNPAIKELILRLRNTLEAHGENRFLVQSKRNFGYRFALRRTEGGITGNDHR